MELNKHQIGEPIYAELLCSIARQYSEFRPDTALFIAHRIHDLIADSNSEALRAKAHLASAVAHGYLAAYDSSNFHCYQSIRFAKSSRDTLTWIDALNNLGIIFMYEENDDLAKDYFRQVENLSRIFGDSLRWGHALNNLGIMYGYEEDFDQELVYYQQASEVFLNIMNKEGYANTLLNIGTVYTAIEAYQEAIPYYDQALAVFKETGYLSGVQNTLLSAAENEQARGNVIKARQMAAEALAMAKDLNMAQDEIYSLELLRQIAVEQGDYKSAFEYLSLEMEVNQEVFNTEKSRQISELEQKYQSAQKEAEIKRLSLENDLKDANIARTRNALFGTLVAGVLLIILVVGYFSLRAKRQKVERESQELQHEALKKRIMELQASPAELALKLDLVELNEKLNTPLTEREFEVFRLGIEGKSNSEIAELLFISINTVKFHMRNSYSKMGVNNRKEAFQHIVKIV